MFLHEFILLPFSYFQYEKMCRYGCAETRKAIIIVKHEESKKVFTVKDGKIYIRHLKEAYPQFRDLSFIINGETKSLKLIAGILVVPIDKVTFLHYELGQGGQSQATY